MGEKRGILKRLVDFVRGADVKASYDAAQNHDASERYWSAADGLSAVSANSPDVRRILRNRSRYEVANNSYARGILNTRAAYTVGEGATLQLTYVGSRNHDRMREVSRDVEQLWQVWSKEVDLWSKVHAMHFAMDQDGEAFALLVSDNLSMRTPISLNFVLYECDQFDLPFAKINQTEESEAGIRVDSAGRPEQYAKLKYHPGDRRWLDALYADFDWIPAAQVIHAFQCERPGQLRGVPKTTPCLERFGEFRRFSAAVVTAAETAAEIAAVMYGDGQPDEDAWTPPGGKWEWPRVDFERGAMVMAPIGAKIEQVKAEQPVTTYDEYTRAVVREITSCLDVPLIMAIGDAGNSNFASAKLDQNVMLRKLEVHRRLVLERQILNRLWQEWLDEALLTDGFLPEVFRNNADDFTVNWRWPQPGHVDRSKEAAGQQVELQNRTTTLKTEYAKQGKDWRVELEQWAEEYEFQRKLGIDPDEQAKRVSQAESESTAEQSGDEPVNESQSP